MRTRRIERLLALIQELQSGRAVTIDDLAKAAGVSRRTIFRDLDLLARAGIPYTYDRATRRYSTDRVSVLPPVSLTHTEALALLMATRHLLTHNMLADRSAAASAGLKIEGMLPQAFQDSCGLLLNNIDVRFDPASDPTSVTEVLPVLQIALIRRSKLRMQYDSYYDLKVIDVVVRPYRLAYIHRGWYMIAFCEREREVRTYKVERILSVQLLAKTYKIDSGFSLDQYLGNAWMMIRGDKAYRVRIRFLKKVAANVDEILWHKTQRTTLQEDGSLIFEATVDGLEEITWWILGYGDQAHVLGPAELRDCIARHAKHMAAYYERNSKAGN